MTSLNFMPLDNWHTSDFVPTANDVAMDDSVDDLSVPSLHDSSPGLSDSSYLSDVDAGSAASYPFGFSFAVTSVKGKTFPEGIPDTLVRDGHSWILWIHGSYVNMTKSASFRLIDEDFAVDRSQMLNAPARGLSMHESNYGELQLCTEVFKFAGSTAEHKCRVRFEVTLELEGVCCPVVLQSTAFRILARQRCEHDLETKRKYNGKKSAERRQGREIQRQTRSYLSSPSVSPLQSLLPPVCISVEDLAELPQFVPQVLPQAFEWQTWTDAPSTLSMPSPASYHHRRSLDCVFSSNFDGMI